jgi:transcriptional regulator with XRE-family HTH domain
LRRHWSIAELARRVGVSHPTIIKIERADPTVAIGTVLEAATVVGVAMFDAEPLVRARHKDRLDTELKLLPRAGRMNTEADDDF